MTKDNETLSPEGQAKRANLKKIAKGTVYAIPVITAFHVGDMVTNEANAYNNGGSPTGGNGGSGGSGGNGGGWGGGGWGGGGWGGGGWGGGWGGGGGWGW